MKPRKNVPKTVAKRIQGRIKASGEHLWTLADFGDASPTAVVKALSRMVHKGEIQRLGRGLYYRPRKTAFGPSKPSKSIISGMPIRHSVFPAGLAAANLLGFTTQNSARPEVATEGSSLPRLIVGKEARVHPRRPAAWSKLSKTDAALLDFLRNRGQHSELNRDETVRLLLCLFRKPGQFERLLKVAASEPPRVRAMLGAVGQQLRQPKSRLLPLRDSLNRLTRFDFGKLMALKHANEWQAIDQ